MDPSIVSVPAIRRVVWTEKGIRSFRMWTGILVRETRTGPRALLSKTRMASGFARLASWHWNGAIAKSKHPYLHHPEFPYQFQISPITPAHQSNMTQSFLFGNWLLNLGCISRKVIGSECNLIILFRCQARMRHNGCVDASICGLIKHVI